MKNLKLTALFLLFFALVISGCKKDETEPIPEKETDTSEMEKLSYDEDFFMRATDDVLEDVGNFLSSETQRDMQDLPCGSVLDSTIYQNDTMYFYLTFDGLNCNQTLYRHGNAVVRTDMSAIWPQANAVVHVQLINFKVTRISDSKWMIFDGYHDYTNVSGGMLIHLGNGLESIEHHIDGDVEVTFMDNTTKTWQVARAKLFTGTFPDLNLETWGYGSYGEYNDLVVWGVDRAGNQFYTQITLPVERRKDCFWKPSAGIKVYNLPDINTTLTLTYGFDENNNPIQPGDCGKKFKLEWQTINSGGFIFLWL